MRPLLRLTLSQANFSTSTLSWNCGEHSKFIVGRILLTFLFEISMTNSDALFDVIVAGLHPIPWVELFFIARGLKFLLFSGSIFQLKFVGYN